MIIEFQLTWQRVATAALLVLVGVIIGAGEAAQPAPAAVTVSCAASPAPARSALDPNVCYDAGVPIKVGGYNAKGQRCYVSHDPLSPGELMFTPVPSSSPSQRQHQSARPNPRAALQHPSLP